MPLFCLLSAFGVIPEQVLLLLTFITGWLTVRSSMAHRARLLVLIAVLILQAAILTAWMNRWTATSAFETYLGAHQGIVCDPTIERVAKSLFWPGAVCMIILLVRSGWRRAESPSALETEPKSLRNPARIALAVEVFILLCMLGNMNTFRSLSSGAVSGRSPDSTIELRLVPMNCMIDVNGLVIYRNRRTFWWHPIGKIGDVLTGCSGGAFQWSSDSRRVTLMMNRGGGGTGQVFEHVFDRPT